MTGGAERLTLLLARALGNADLCVGYRVPSVITENELKGLRCHEISPQCQIPVLRLLVLMQAFTYGTKRFSGYDWAVYGGSAAPLAVRNPIAERNILYCHTIPRFAYDLKSFYLSRLPPWQRPLLNLLAAYMRLRYEAAFGSMDTVVANSENVRRRIGRYLNRDSTVVYPPCQTRRFRWKGQSDYYLSTARLENFKRVELVVRAFMRMPEKKLVVASGGSELRRLQTLARDADNIHFTGWIGENRLEELMGSAIATLYLPVDEDFGMSPVESMAAGKPVIGVAEGGLLETVVEGETGMLVGPHPSVEEVVEAVREMTPERARSMRRACEARAQAFGESAFVEKMREIVHPGT